MRVKLGDTFVELNPSEDERHSYKPVDLDDPATLKQYLDDHLGIVISDPVDREKFYNDH